MYIQTYTQRPLGPTTYTMTASLTFRKTFVDLVQVNRQIKKEFDRYGFTHAVCNLDWGIITIYFQDELPPSEETERLRRLIYNMTEEPIEMVASCINVLTVPISTDTTDWMLLCLWAFPGVYSQPVKKVTIDSVMTKDSPADTYSCRVYDTVNNIVICSFTADNTSSCATTLSIDTDKLPLTKTDFELHAKVSNGLASATIRHVSIIMG